MINQKLPKRKNVRLPNWRYDSAGSYFVTMCSYERGCIFGTVEDDFLFHPSELGQVIRRTLLKIPTFFHGVEMEYWVVMPNHVHAIIDITTDDQVHLSNIVKWFKTESVLAAKRAGVWSEPVWQRGFYEHIILTEKRMYALREYIQNNPVNWHLDENNPNRF